MFHKLLFAAYTFNIKPDPTAPGGPGLVDAGNKAAFYALAVAGIGFLVSLAMMAASKAFHLERLHNHGKEGVIISLAAMFIVGTADGFLNAAYKL